MASLFVPCSSCACFCVFPKALFNQLPRKPTLRGAGVDGVFCGLCHLCCPTVVSSPLPRGPDALRTVSGAVISSINRPLSSFFLEISCVIFTETH